MRFTWKVDPFTKRRELSEKSVAPLSGKKPHISLYSTDDPVDKLHLVLAPLVSSVGIVYPKISEPLPAFTSQYPALNDLALWNNLTRKLSCIPGFKTAPLSQDIQEQLYDIGALYFSPPVGIPPEFVKTSADRGLNFMERAIDARLGFMMNSFRFSPASSIILNIKVGEGSPIQKIQDARNLAISIKSTLDKIQVNSSVFLTSFHQPLGQALGNSVEVREAIDILKGSGPLDILKLTLELGSDILLLADEAMTKSEAKKMLKMAIVEGRALKKFKEIIEAQNGNSRIIDDYSLLPVFSNKIHISSWKSGFIHKINMSQLHSLYLKLMSSGRESSHREKREIGFLIQRKIGEWIKKGEIIVEVHLDRTIPSNWIGDEFQKIFTISESPPPFQPLIIERITDGA